MVPLTGHPLQQHPGVSTSGIELVEEALNLIQFFILQNFSWEIILFEFSF